MSGLEDRLNQQDAVLKRRMEAGRQRELLAAKNLRDYRDLMVARGVSPDEVYASEKTDDLRPAARGWIVSNSILDSWGTTASYSGLLVTEDARLFGYFAWNLGQRPGRRPSGYFSDELFLTLGEERHIDHDFGLNDALERLAAAARRYLR